MSVGVTGGLTTSPEQRAVTATVDIVVPVYNEERALPGCIHVLREFLRDQFPFDWTIVVADNASTDRTLEVAEALARDDESGRVRHLDRNGRGKLDQRTGS